MVSFDVYLWDYPKLNEPKTRMINLCDCQYLPIARSDFDKMSVFGSRRLRAAVAIKPLA